MIGLFDSGLGGLTILRELQQRLPNRQFIYLGDNARTPYGTKTPDQIREYTRQGVSYLFIQGCRLVILACNTASAHALRYLQQELQAHLGNNSPPHRGGAREGKANLKLKPYHSSSHRLLGIIVPTVEFVTGADWRHTHPITTPISAASLTIGVLATASTIESDAYPREIHRRNQSLTVVQQACPNLASLIEQNTPRESVEQEISACVSHLERRIGSAYHALLLGCTHYDLVADSISQHLAPGVKLYRQPPLVTDSLIAYLNRHPELDTPDHTPPITRYLTTGDAATVNSLAANLINQTIRFKTIDITL